MDQQNPNPNRRRQNHRKRPAPGGAPGPGAQRQQQQRNGQRPQLENSARGRGEYFQAASNSMASAAAAPVASSVAPASGTGPEIASDAPRFADLASENLVHPTLLKTLTEDMKFDRMTEVQAATIRHLITDRGDVLAQAKTGTGKTIAFLLPAIQTLLKRPRSRGQGVSLLVISPTRELALQIAKEAELLLQNMPGYKVCTAIGGTSKIMEEKRILSGCQVLIATPGRLYDHLTTGVEDGDLDGSRVRATLSGLDTLVLDEADRLLDMGFLPSLKQIVACLPDRADVPRQGMLFSATVSDQVKNVAGLALAKQYKFISTIPEGEANTHERVPQHLVTVPTFADMAPALVGALRHELAQPGLDPKVFKAIVFAPTAGLVDFYAAVLEGTPGLPPVSALHSRLSQGKRTAVTNEFRNASAGVLVATDVIARGMDFPAVSNVIQAGIPLDRESYIHRLGRTARAGAEGRGTLIVTSVEAFFPRRVMKDVTFVEQDADLSERESILVTATSIADIHPKIYQAWLGFYKVYTKSFGWSLEQLVQEANKFARDGLGAPEPVPIAKSTVGKMGMKGTRGLNLVPDPPKQGNRRGGGRPKAK